ncbi:Gfo/Idh/MocA family oxidoreductase [Paenibacillus sp. HB172176]|uniref:Gfo/Idh/MocA family protein n=1 Tax=Paenibacillus sp. HB172176 TaxID=2493690 RepID=UPI001439C4CA|nr:Gfo/Idh/MocA family oxidoreductase [Paenibacillus sp. HB172176]
MTSKYRVVVAGCGGMANTWVGYALNRSDTEIVGLVDIKLEFAEKMAERHGLNCGLYTDVQKAIKDTHANLVFDVTIPASHFSISTTALRNGCSVFGEKPLAESMAECNAIVQLSEQTGQTHAVMQNRRYDPRIRALRGLIEGDSIGKVGFIGADFFIGAHFGGFRDVMASPLLLDMAIHTFDQARLISGANPMSVYCQEFNPPGSWYEGSAAAICIFEMSDGSIFNYRGSWCAEGAPTSWEASWRVTGSKGTAIWDGIGNPYAEVAVEAEQSGKFIKDYMRVESEVQATDNSFHQGCLDEMFLSLEENRHAETDCRDNRYSMAMVLAALESSKKGRKVDIVAFMNGES